MMLKRVNLRNADDEIKFLLVADTGEFSSASESPAEVPRITDCSVSRRRIVAVAVVVVPVGVWAICTCITSNTFRVY